MITFARIVDGHAVDVTTGQLDELFHADVAAQFVAVPDGTGNGDRFDGAAWTKAPNAPPAPEPVLMLPSLTPMTFYLAFTPAERIKIKKSSDEQVVEFWSTYQLAVQLDKPIDPNLISVQEGLAYLAQGTTDTPSGPGILASKDRIEQILNGIPQ